MKPTYRRVLLFRRGFPEESLRCLVNIFVLHLLSRASWRLSRGGGICQRELDTTQQRIRKLGAEARAHRSAKP